MLIGTAAIGLYHDSWDNFLHSRDAVPSDVFVLRNGWLQMFIQHVLVKT